MRELLAIFLFSFAFLSFAVQAKDLDSEIVELSSENQEILFSSSKLIILDIYSPKCRYCQKLQPVFADIHEEYGHLCQFVSLNVREDDTSICSDFKVKNIPTILFIQDGREISRFTGLISKTKFIAEIKRILNEDS